MKKDEKSQRTSSWYHLEKFQIRDFVGFWLLERKLCWLLLLPAAATSIWMGMVWVFSRGSWHLVWTTRLLSVGDDASQASKVEELWQKSGNQKSKSEIRSAWRSEKEATLQDFIFCHSGVNRESHARHASKNCAPNWTIPTTISKQTSQNFDWTSYLYLTSLNSVKPISASSSV